MVELGQLEGQHEAFDKRGMRIVAVSLEGLEEAKVTQADFPHLLVLSDAKRGLANAVHAVHAGAGPEGSDTGMPTTLLVDEHGIVRWIFRPDTFIGRLSPAEVLAGVDQYLPK